MTRSVFVSGLESTLGNSSYFVENLNGSFSGLEGHSMIENCFSLVSSQYLRGNSNYPKGIQIVQEFILGWLSLLVSAESVPDNNTNYKGEFGIILCTHFTPIVLQGMEIP